MLKLRSHLHLPVFLLLFLSCNRCLGISPNILLIVSEDNGPELGCYGDRSAVTPHLNQLATQGLLFTRAYVPQAGCSQSRASFMTGLYPHQHGQIGLATWGFRMYRNDTPNLASRLKQIGFRTGLIGKLHINPKTAFPFDMHAIQSANFQRNDLNAYARQAESFINADDAPFFLSVNYPDAHDPWIRQVQGLPPRPQTNADVKVMEYMGVDSKPFRTMVADYYNCISRLDTLVGDLLKVLHRSGKSDNTIVIYIGDHGADMLRGKRTCYEGGLRIPMLIRWPRQITPQIRDQMVSTLDLLPTLLEITGAEPVIGLPGSSLRPLFKPGNVKWRSEYCAEYHTHAAAPNYFPQRSIRTDRFKLIETLLPNTIHPDYENTIEKLHRDFRTQTYSGSLDVRQMIGSARKRVQAAYKLMRCPPRYQLYDLNSDPYEFLNLAENPDYAATFTSLRSRLTEWRVQTADPLLDQEKLDQLTREVRSVQNKSIARKYTWKYPKYLLSN